MPAHRHPCSPAQVVKGLRLGGLKEALDLIAKGEAKAEEFKVSMSSQRRAVCLDSPCYRVLQ